ncbi:MAG: hypothetical protein DRJ63_06245 [Thermoprotei archaeon]|nr:MAG: hypothetical protein DRJ63_06245 [Thermoprotei archaeon]
MFLQVELLLVSDLVEYSISFTVDRKVPLTAFSGVFVYRLFLTLVSQVDSLLAEDLHGSRKFKPISCHPVYFDSRIIKRGTLFPNRVYSTKVLILSEDVNLKFARALLDTSFENIILPACVVKVEKIGLRISSFRQILSEAEKTVFTRGFTIVFKTPCQLGKLTYRKTPIFRLFPDPYYVLRNLYNYWNAFTETPISEDFLKWVDENIHEEKFSLVTEPVYLGEGRVTVGFTGHCAYRVRDSGREYLKALAALLFFGEWVGVGKHRSIGMGRVECKLS